MRIEAGPLRDRRAARTSRILVTGATGFLGSHIAFALLRAGYRVAVLARPTKTLPARGRMARLADWFGIEAGSLRSLEVIEGDILSPGWAAAALAGPAGAGPVDEIIHCASSTSFAERKRAEIEQANIGGLRNVLDFAARSGCLFFHHISTAYVAGRRSGRCLEEWAETGPFTNVYEETKARGEILARDLCRREGIRLGVYRPTIVTGDSRTGRTLKFNALYFPVKAAVFLRDLYLADIRERGGRRAAELGIRVEDGGRIILPLRLQVAAQGGLNLVPIDHCVRAFLALFEDGLEGGIYHIANPRPTRLEDIIAWSGRRFGIGGVETCGPESFAVRPKSALESLYDSYLDVYRPYMQDERTFEDARAAPVLEGHGIVCPAFDETVFSRCMDYAVEADWGARLFPGERDRNRVQ
jgi:nucleoside-diphosphate-sugar epimerase